MKVGKPKSKRVPVRLRHKIEKASAAKQRKNRKLAKKNPEWRSRLKKDPGIPNLFPYKEKLLQDIEAKKRLKEEEVERRRADARLQSDAGSAFEGSEKDLEMENGVEDEGFGNHGVDGEDESSMVLDADAEADNSNPMAALLASARARAVHFDKGKDQSHADDVDAMQAEGPSDDEEWSGLDSGGASDSDGDFTRPVAAGGSSKDHSRRAFDKLYKQVVDSADVVLYVLDARDPESTRSREVETAVLSAAGGQKRLLFVLNKIDLIPPHALQAWLRHLRRSFPTLPLRASTAASNACTFDHGGGLTTKATGEALFRALKTYALGRKGVSGVLTVGVVGFPNVGKSSVINCLTRQLGGRRGACPTGAEPGVTTGIREVKLDGKVRVLDSPGIVFGSGSAGGKNARRKAGARTAATTTADEATSRLLLLNALPTTSSTTDPIPAITHLLARLSAADRLDTLISLYGLTELMPTSRSAGADDDRTTDFLVQVARRRGRLGKGGVPNLHSAALAVLADWRDGRIAAWAQPPDLVDEVVHGEGREVRVVEEWGREFKLDGLWGDGVEEGATGGRDGDGDEKMGE